MGQTFTMMTPEDLAAIDTRFKALEDKVSKLDKPPVVPPPPDPPPVPTARQLLGGWKLAGPFFRAGTAIQFDSTGKLPQKAWLVGMGEGAAPIYEYDLPPMGTGSDVNAWPRVDPVREIAPWWERGHCNGLVLWKGKLWAAPRVFYATGELIYPDLILYAEDGEQLRIDFPGGADQAKFAGFVKRGPDLDFDLGGGGYKSGSPPAAGPTWATRAGEKLIDWDYPSLPDPGNWNLRCPRPANYIPFTRTWAHGDPDRVPHPDAETHPERDDPRFTWDASIGYWKGEVKDDWPAWIPRNGEGRWASDRVWGGGLIVGTEVWFWPRMATKRVDYFQQGAPGSTFGDTAFDRTYLYKFDRATRALKGWEETDLGCVRGQEIDAAGRLYLSVENQWQGDGPYKVDPAMLVYG